MWFLKSGNCVQQLTFEWYFIQLACFMIRAGIICDDLRVLDKVLQTSKGF